MENHRGQWIQHTSTTGTAKYTYDNLGRLTQAVDQVTNGGACTVRGYGFTGSPRSNRTQYATASTATGACPTVTLGAATATYDTADRLVSNTSDGTNKWIYDPFGRITSLPTAAGPIKNEYFVNDLIQRQTQAGVSRATWTLDSLHRRSSNTIEAWVNNAWANSVTKVSHYANDSDEPSWIAEDVSLPSDVSRFVSGAEGALAIITSTTGDRELQLVNLHGDVVGSIAIADQASTVSWPSLQYWRADEFGKAVPLTGSLTSAGTPGRYGWLGAAQRSSEALGGVVLMGVRLYAPVTGRFLSSDPVAGGSANAYDYCNADPVNCTDLGGTWSFGQILSAVAVVGEVASFIPGPIGAAAAGISAVAYAAQGNTAKAIEMGVTAAAQLVGAGAVVRVAARAINVARSGGQLAARAAPRLWRGSTSAQQAVASACRIPNSFVPGTLVLMADGSLQPIENVQAGDQVLSTDPATGTTSEQPVLSSIQATGDKELVIVSTGQGSWTATTRHPIWVEDAGWTDAGLLRRGDALLATGEGTVIVEAVEHLGVVHNQTVHNLHVAGYHTYYVVDGSDETLAHNCAMSRRPTPRERLEVIRTNVLNNGGIERCSNPLCRVPTTVPTQSRRGFRIPGTDRNFDHILAWSRGGPTRVWNLQILCRVCNLRKGAS